VDSAAAGIPARPDLSPAAPPAEPPLRRRGRSIAFALVLSLLAPAVLGLVAVVPWSDGDTAFAFLDRRPDGSPVRWDPCRSIHYQVNLRYAPPDATDDVFEAVARASRASGIAFVFDGSTDRSPTEQGQANFRRLDLPGYQPVLISWLPAELFDSYADPREVIGVGIATTGERSWVYQSGMVVINADAPLLSGFGSGFSLGPVLLHELGHVLGLGHVGDADEIMWAPDLPGSNPSLFSNATNWGDGDLEGLRRVGRPAGCVPS
jgi:matrixin